MCLAQTDPKHFTLLFLSWYPLHESLNLYVGHPVFKTPESSMKFRRERGEYIPPTLTKFRPGLKASRYTRQVMTALSCVPSLGTPMPNAPYSGHLMTSEQNIALADFSR